MRKPSGAFTLIELLIVVAIIAILATIALPNFMEAQTRAKVASIKNDFRVLGTGLATYYVDYNSYIVDYLEKDFKTWTQLTTPVAYLNGVLYMPYNSQNSPHNETNRNRDVYDYGGGPGGDVGKQYGMFYFVVCPGPDRFHNFRWAPSGTECIDKYEEQWLDLFYDSTNGTMSSGDLFSSNKKTCY
jgi:prepilin-type N-terminal cleavage/methylation domain-containing protein